MARERNDWEINDAVTWHDDNGDTKVGVVYLVLSSQLLVRDREGGAMRFVLKNEPTLKRYEG